MSALSLIKLRRILLGLALIFTPILPGCESPKSPSWDIDVRLPFSRDSLPFDDLLPADIDTGSVEGERVFLFRPKSDSSVATLADICGSGCASLQGQTAPVPGFQHVDSLELLFDSDLISAVVASSRFFVQIANGLGFDLLRPHPDPDSAGSLTFRTVDLGRGITLDSTVIRGTSRTLAPGDTLEAIINLGGVTVTGGAVIEMTLNSPADGQVAVIDTAESLSFQARLDSVTLSAIDAVVDSDTVGGEFVAKLDADIRKKLTTEIAPELSSSVQSASFEIRVTHDLDIEGPLTISFAGKRPDLFSNTPSEVRLNDIDFSPAPGGRTAERSITADEMVLLAELPTVLIAYRAIVTGVNRDPLGRPAASLTPGLSSEIQLAVAVRLRVSG